MAFSGVSVTMKGNTYNDTSFLNDGHQTAFLEALRDFLLEADDVNTATADSEAARDLAQEWSEKAEDSEITGNAGSFSSLHWSAKTADIRDATEVIRASTEGYRDTTLTYRNTTETYKNQAIAAAAASTKGIDYITTGGTATAYTADFTPNVTVVDGVLFNLDIHSTNTSTTPTLAVEGGTAYPLVLGYDRRPIPVGLLFAGVNVTVTFDGTNNEYQIIGGMPLFELNRNLDGRGNTIDDAVIDNSTIQNSALVNCSGAGSRNVVASGTIASGKVFALRSDGTVEEVSSSTVAFDAGTLADAGGDSTANGNHKGVYDSVNNKIAVFWINSSDEINFEVGTVSAGVITFSASVETITTVTGSGGPSGLDAVFHEAEEVCVCVYGTVTEYLHAVAVDISSGTPSVGSIVNYSDSNADGVAQVRCCYNSVDERVVSCWSEEEGTVTLIKSLSASGTTLDVSGDASSLSAGNEHLSIAYSPYHNKVVVVFVKATAKWAAHVASCDGADMSLQAQYHQFNTIEANPGNNALHEVHIAYHPKEKKFGVICVDSAGGDLYGCVLDLTAYGVTRSGYASFHNGTALTGGGFDLVYEEASNALCLVAQSLDGAATTSTQVLKCYIEDGALGFDIAASTITAGLGPRACALTSGTLLFVPRNLACHVVTINHTATNADEWVGIAEQAAVDGATFRGAFEGNVATGLTGLTPGARYYLADNGTYSTAKTKRFLGRALSSTEMMLTTNREF